MAKYPYIYPARTQSWTLEHTHKDTHPQTNKNTHIFTNTQTEAHIHIHNAHTEAHGEYTTPMFIFPPPLMIAMPIPKDQKMAFIPESGTSMDCQAQNSLPVTTDTIATTLVR